MKQTKISFLMVLVPEVAHHGVRHNSGQNGETEKQNKVEIRSHSLIRSSASRCYMRLIILQKCPLKVPQSTGA